MTAPLFLTRAKLRRDASIAALAPVLLPPDSGARAGASHRLIWSLFADDPDARRDFLYRQTMDGPRTTFFILSHRQPSASHALFELETKPFEPALAAGDRLTFSLRANPTVAHGKPGSGRGKPHNVVAEALNRLPREARAEARRRVIFEAGMGWLEKKAARSGFGLHDPGGMLRIDGDNWSRIRRPADRDVTFATLDFDGVLTVADPAVFLSVLAQGFGRARAFGCGLMLIKRA